MKWLARLKKMEIAPEVQPTKPTKPGFVGFVAPILPPIRKTGGDSRAANDRMNVAPLVNAAAGNDGVNAETPVIDDRDRLAWPHSTAMNGAEIDSFTARLARFTDKGLTRDDGEALADKLVTRDREADDRRLCLECTHLAGYSGTWGCRAWQRVGVAIKARDAGLPGDFVRLLQRCDGFTATT